MGKMSIMESPSLGRLRGGGEGKQGLHGLGRSLSDFLWLGLSWEKLSVLSQVLAVWAKWHRVLCGLWTASAVGGVAGWMLWKGLRALCDIWTAIFLLHSQPLRPKIK